MSNIISWYPRANNRIVLFEVTDLEGRAMWGGEPPAEAVEWLMRDPLNRRIIATHWFADEEDAAPIGEGIDLTRLVMAAVAEGRARNRA